MTIGLAMLVKDAEDTLPATLASALPVIDAWTIIDTGSSDNTCRIADDLAEELPGQLWRKSFKGFGPSRTELLEAAKVQGCDYTLMLDADHVLHREGPDPAAGDLTADSYLIRVRGPLEWRLPLLTRSAHPFEYRGVAHAYLASDAPTREEKTDWLSIDGGAGATTEKLQRDRLLLDAQVAEHPDDARSTYYLAQTYRDLDMPKQAIHYYLRRAAMGGFEEERWNARYQAGVLLGAYVEGIQGAEELVRAWRERPTRAESMRALARLADSVADKLEKPDDILFVTPSAYGKAT